MIAVSRSQVNIRRAIGILAIAVPWLCALATFSIKSSVSEYYHSNAQDVLVGVLVSIGFCLSLYRGYDKKDMVASVLAGVACIVVAIFPSGKDYPVGVFQLSALPTNIMHGISAGVLFLTIAYMCFFLFTKGDTSNPDKRKRNVVYYTCSICILFGGFLMIANTFFGEVVMLTSFGIAWLVKGETLFKDT
jgi:hypothetical protein